MPLKRVESILETPVREEELDELDYFRDLRDRHLVINGLRICWRPKAKTETLGLSEKELRSFYEAMTLGRLVEEHWGELFRQGLVPGTAFFGRGNEALSVAAALVLEDDDTLVPMHRNISSHIARGQDLAQLMCQFMAKADGITKGRDIHFGNRDLNIIPLISHIGTMIPVAAGAAWASKYRNDGTAVLGISGDGATSSGDFHQGLNLAAVHGLPLVVVIENNLWAYKTPSRMQYACKTLVLRAIGYGIPGYLMDATDMLGAFEICREAVSRARAGEGPILIESVNPRLCGHSIYDPYKDYVSPEEIASWDAKDPILLYRERLRSLKVGDDSYFKSVEEQNLAKVTEAVNVAKKSPMPEGPQVMEGVYAP